MTHTMNKRVSYDIGCMKSLRKLPDRVALRFMDLMTKYMSDPSANGLNLETVEGSKDSSIKSLRVDQGYRAIAFEVGRDIMFVHVNEHDKAYRWAAGRRVKLDPETNRIRVIEEVDAVIEPVATPDISAPRLFDEMTDARLRALGVPEEELTAVRQIPTIEALEGAEDRFDPLTYQILYAVAAGYADEEIQALTGVGAEPDAEPPQPAAELTFGKLIETEQSRQTIFIPESEAELRRVFEEGLEGWRVFLHPEQRKIAYRDYNGPVLVRGGAGTGKTVVAMHRAKHLADQIERDPTRAGQRVLLTTFTTSLAHDIDANLRTLCPAHLDVRPPRIEVINLDRWVSQFLKRKNFAREVAFFGEARDRLDQVWREVFDDHELPEGLSDPLVRAEWAQIVQAKGLTDKKGYLKASRAGRGTPLDRKKRAVLWDIFADYRARLISEGLAEPDDAYREATEILTAEAPNLPYAAVIVDEAQDMGEQAFRLIRAIVPDTPTGDRNSLFIVGDAHQRIYGRRAAMSACGINVRGRSKRLRLNYRTTQEIRAWAVSVLEGVRVDDLDEGTDTLRGYVSLMRGVSPELIGCRSEPEELDGLVAWVRVLPPDQIRLSDIGVLCARRADADRVQVALRATGIETVMLQSGADDRSVPGIRITTMHRAKGLEFFAVAIPFLSDTAFPPPGALRTAVDGADREDILAQYRSLLHVAATRAKKALRISWSGTPTGMIKG
ncbi:MAG TPA: UvrD-helicase domain-containing protein [Paracoccus sp. (in: a-proteobacteria)]|uniref:UvrD-helicase domain-containing protein n=1 Tax=Paracoccus sp. TaxID=267 RepID=UPI002BAB2BE5|nr:UvrD-helicase domain-containing protein [Paracoccus sp. (in: a-proteobacteria)]HWL55739.1 UvrD-helicase domain-containing protein [Paracoccus sp. (in: a-proteobacteria)]